jgi:hypothetical protein
VQNFLSSNFLSKNIKIKVYRTVVLPVVLYGCETWSLTLREECMLRVSENRAPRNIFGPMRDEVTGEWIRLYNEELNDLYYSLNNSHRKSNKLQQCIKILFHIYMKLNMFRATHRPSSGA